MQNQLELKGEDLEIQDLGREFIKSRDHKTFNKLSNLISPLIKRSVRGILKGDSLDISEATNNTLLKIWQLPDDWHFSEDKRFVSFIRTTAMNVARTKYGQHKTRDFITITEDSIPRLMNAEEYYSMSAEEREEELKRRANQEKIRVTRELREIQTDGDSELSLDHIIYYNNPSAYSAEENTSNDIRDQLFEVNSFLESYDAETQSVIFDTLIRDNPLSYDDAKIKYGFMTNGAVKTRIHRFRRRLKDHMNAHFHQGREIEKFRFRHANGVIRIEAGVYHTEDNQPVLHGEFIEYYNDGNVKMTGFYRNHEQHGQFVHYSVDGRVTRINHFQSGFRHGTDIRFDEAGQREELADYYMDELGYYEIYEDGVMIENGISEPDVRDEKVDRIFQQINRSYKKQQPQAEPVTVHEEVF